jgi:hypothetical protein
LLVEALRWQRSDAQDLRLRGTALRDAIRIMECAAAASAMPDLGLKEIAMSQDHDHLDHATWECRYQKGT